MPTINISPRIRFGLYLAGVVGAVLVQYAIDKAWFGEAEFRLWSGVAAVLFTLAAAKTDLSPNASSDEVAKVAEEIRAMQRQMVAINEDNERVAQRLGSVINDAAVQGVAKRRRL